MGGLGAVSAKGSLWVDREAPSLHLGVSENRGP